ncbi:hypothetical protein [Thermococcus sp.]
MELLSTGFKKLDRAIGGGLTPDSIVLIIHGSYSWGWALAFSIMANRIQQGDFGVIMNTVLPFSSLEIELNPIGINLGDLGTSNDLAIIDVFSSFLGIKYPKAFENFIYTIEHPSFETFVPKYYHTYRRILEGKMKERRPVGVDFTLDGLAFFIGEENTLRVFQRFIALKEQARVYENRARPINILVLNRNRVSEGFLSWFSMYAQYVIEIEPLQDNTQKLEIKKSPLLYTPGEPVLELIRKKGCLRIK